MRITKAIRQQVLDEAGWQCEYCGTKLNEFNAEIDHKIPISKGGSSDRSNLAATCPRCNMVKADKIIDFVANPISKKAAEAWIHAYIKSPKLTSLLSLILTIVFTFLVYYLNHSVSEKRQIELSNNLDFKVHIQQLDQTEANLKQLLGFIELQKNQMIINEQSLHSLKEEQEKLQPLVSAEKKMVDALFAAQEARAKSDASRERWIGFGLGIASSILASVLIIIVQYFIRVARKKTVNNT